MAILTNNDRQVPGQEYRLATAEITYRMPDHPNLLQTYVWQDYDIAPSFPELRRFLKFWDENLDSPVHSVRIGSVGILEQRELRHADICLTLQ